MESNYVDRALAGYERVHGPEAPAATRSGSYEALCENRRYIVVGNASRILSCYRLRRGSLWLMLRWPPALDARHHERVMRYVHDLA
jgi:hypothetical protein